MKVRSSVKWVLIGVLVFVSAGIQAQQTRQVLFGHNGASPQIVDPIDEGNLLAFPGNRLPLFRADRDLGPVASDMVLERMQLLLKRSAEQESALQILLHSQQDINSPLYHHWLAPEEFGSQFGPAQEDIDKITAWLQSKGIKVTSVAKGRTSIEFSATHEQIQNAFHTELHWFDTTTGRQYSNVLNPQIPAALGRVVAGISSLNSLVSRPLSHVVQQISGKGGVSGNPPSYLSGSSNYLAPGDFWTIYNATPTETGGITGNGVTIGIAGRSDVAASDVATFRSSYLGNSYSGTFQQLHNGPDPGIVSGDDVENALDVEWATALAPDARLVLVSSLSNGEDGLLLSAQYLIDNNLADIVSVSYGECESFLWTGGILEYSDLWEQAAAQGITVAVAAGDSGSAGCDDDQYAQAEFGLQVNGLASSPYDVAVGGTEFVDQGNSWAPSTGSTPLPGTSAQGYIPEEVWNESQTYSTLYAGSGGASNCYFSILGNAYDTADCAGGWPKPDWQTGVTGIPADGVRDLPDVSFTAALHDGYLITSQSETWVVGGTSAATPSFAGVMALINQKAGGRQGLANYQLYTLAGQEFGAAGAVNLSNLQSCNASIVQNSGNSCVFYDVTSGSNAIPCVGGTENCSATSSDTTGMLTGYETGTGYDLASGLGSINITNLVNSWNVPSKGNSPSTTSLQISPTSGIVHGSPVSVSITVAPTSGSGTPTGSVSLVANGAGVATGQLSSRSWSGNIASLPGGNYQVTAQYSGDSTLAASTSAPMDVSVSPEPSTTTVSVSATDAQVGNPLPVSAIPYGSNVILSGTVKGQFGLQSPASSSAYMTFTAGGSSYAGLVNSVGYSAYPITTLSLGAYSATATYQGDFNLASSTSSTPAQFTIVPASTAITLSSGTPSNGTTPITAVVSADSFGNAPTGAVAFFVNGTQVGTATVQPDGGALLHWAATTFNLSTTLLNEGANAVTAQYLGDANYAQSPVSAPLSLTPNTVTVTSPSPPAAPSLAQELKPGAQISISAIILGRFQNLQVQWAPGINPTLGWSNSGITISTNLSQPVLNVPVATWDTSSIGTAGYYTLSVSATNGGVTNTATTYVHLEPDLFSENWPLWISDVPIPMHDALVSAENPSGTTDLLMGSLGNVENGAQILSVSLDASTKTSYLVGTGSYGLPAAANLHFVPGDDLIFPDWKYVSVVRPDGTIDELTPPASVNNLVFAFTYAQAVIDDVDGDSIPEIITVGIGGAPGSYTSTAYLFAWRNNGQQVNSNFPVPILDANTNIQQFAQPRVLVGDVDGDGQEEFMVLEGTSETTFTPRLFAADGTPKQWNAPTLQMYSNQMALADLDHNGKLETIIDSADGYLHVLNPDGSERPGWPQPITQFALTDSIAVGDLNQDGNEKIVVSHGGVLTVFNCDGSVSWTKQVYGGFGPAVLADVNGDGYPEIVVPFGYVSTDSSFPTYDVFQLLILDRTGTTIRSWTLSGMDGEQIDWATVDVGDFLNDGKTEIALGFQVEGLNSSGINLMGGTVLSTGWNYNAAASDWPMLHRNSRQSAVLRRVSPTTINLSSSANPSNGASPTTLTIAVAPSAGGSGVPTGTVNLIDGDQNIGWCVLSAGSCSMSPVLSLGIHSLIAGYVGDQNYGVSYSSVITQKVNNLVSTAMALTITPNGGSLTAGAGYTLTATVTPSSGTTVPTGSVVFSIGSATQTVALNASGVATYLGTVPTTSGQLSLSAAYQGSTEFSTSTSNSLTESIITNAIPTISSMSPAYTSAESATFTLTVNGTRFVKGSTISWGNTALSTQFVSPLQLTAQVLSTDVAAPGATAITVQSPAPGGGTSNAQQFEVDSAAAGSATAPSFSTATATVSAGNAASYPISLPSSASAVSVNCLNLPTGASCNYSASSGAVSITTFSSTSTGIYQITTVFSETLPGSASAAFMLMPIFLLPLLYLRRKLTAKGTWIMACMALILVAGAGLASGCGGGAGSQPIQPTHQVTTSGVVWLTVN